MSVTKLKKAFLWESFLGSPFFDLLNLFPVIFLKEFALSGLELAIILALRPACSLVAPYWSAMIHRRQDLVKINVVVASIIRYLPFIFFGWYKSHWMFLLSISIYWVVTHGMKPAWMEYMKVVIPEGKREKVCSDGLKINYCANMIFPLFLGKLLDLQWVHWQWLFCFTALIGMLPTFFLIQLPVLKVKFPANCSQKRQWSLSKLVMRPWKDVGQLLIKNRSFFRFQCSFFLAGSGLVLFHPATKQFFVDLHLSYTVIATALMMAKGVGFLVASPFWVRRFQSTPLLQLGRLVMVLGAGFPFLLLLGRYSVWSLYIAYFVYGVMQAGSGLVWHLSGPSYAKEKSSSVYSSANLFTVGLRGVTFPFIGTFLMGKTNPSFVLFVGSLVIFLGIFMATIFLQKEKAQLLQKKGLFPVSTGKKG